MERGLGSYQVYRMECEKHLGYSLWGYRRLFFKKLAALALVLTLFSSFFIVNPAAAQQRLVCDPLMFPPSNPPLMTPACLAVPAVTAVFPPGSTAPAAGMPMDSVSEPLVPVGDQSTGWNPCWWDPGWGCIGQNMNLYGLTPTPPTTAGSSYPAGPFYGVAITPGFREEFPGGPQCSCSQAPGGVLYSCAGGGGVIRSQPIGSFTPPATYGSYTGVWPSIIAPQNASPYGMGQDVCWDGFMGWVPCGGVHAYNFQTPVDPIVFVPDGRAYMWPVGTSIISGGTQSTLVQQGASFCNATTCAQYLCTAWDNIGPPGWWGSCIAWDFSTCLCEVCTNYAPGNPTVTINPGDIVLAPMVCPPIPPGGTCSPNYDIGCPPGFVARQYDAVGGFTCLTMEDYMAALPPICDYTVDPTCTGGVIIPPPPGPGACVGAGCMTGPGSGLLPGLCDSGGYMGAFGFLAGLITGINPCEFTMDQLGLSFAQNFEGGEQFSIYMEDWWFNTYLPDLQDMTKQWNTAILDQSLSLGQFMDASNQTKQQDVLQTREVEAMERYKPSENTCSMASIAPGLQRALQSSRAMKSAMLHESASRALNLPGSGTESGARVYHSSEWANYCTIFADPTDNRGVTNGCGGVAGLRGADVDVERFLFRDTINMNNANERLAAQTILKNLVDYWVHEPIHISAANTAQARKQINARNHYATLRQAVVEPVAGIIARRSAIPNSGYEVSVQDIRLAAGVPAALRHASPSYNEAVLARSKEYFMNLDTLLKTNTDLGALRQDQLVNEALIAILLEDIAEVEAQINTVLQARTSIKFNQAESVLSEGTQLRNK